MKQFHEVYDPRLPPSYQIDYWMQTLVIAELQQLVTPGATVNGMDLITVANEASANLKCLLDARQKVRFN